MSKMRSTQNLRWGAPSLLLWCPCPLAARLPKPPISLFLSMSPPGWNTSIISWHGVFNRSPDWPCIRPKDPVLVSESLRKLSLRVTSPG